MQRSRIARTVAIAVLVMAGLLLAAVAAFARPNRMAGNLAAQTTPAAPPTATKPASTEADGAYITVNPAAGFPLDPFLVSVQGGGPVEASTLSEDCAGYVPAGPTVSVDYKGDADRLRAFFYSDGDPVLVVQTPDGSYLCNDDTSRLIPDPMVEISKPVQGLYNVWVGSAVKTDLVPGFLVFTAHTDLDAARFALGSLVKRQPAPAFQLTNPRLAAAAERIKEAKAAVKSAEALKAGGKPVTKDFTASGVLPAVELQTGDTLCGGLVSVKPDYAFDWSGDAKALNVLVEANGDTTLLVRTPDGAFLCADDADSSNLNPVLSIARPAAGRYLVWVGRVDPSKPVTGKLTLTEAAGATPKALKKP